MASGRQKRRVNFKQIFQNSNFSRAGTKKKKTRTYSIALYPSTFYYIYIIHTHIFFTHFKQETKIIIIIILFVPRSCVGRSLLFVLCECGYYLFFCCPNIVSERLHACNLFVPSAVGVIRMRKRTKWKEKRQGNSSAYYYTGTGNSRRSFVGFSFFVGETSDCLLHKCACVFCLFVCFPLEKKDPEGFFARKSFFCPAGF